MNYNFSDYFKLLLKPGWENEAAKYRVGLERRYGVDLVNEVMENREKVMFYTREALSDRLRTE